MTQAQLARAINSSERNIVRWENDQNRPRLEHIAAIAEATGADIADLMNGNGESSEDDEESDPVAALMFAVQAFVRHLDRRKAVA